MHWYFNYICLTTEALQFYFCPGECCNFIFVYRDVAILFFVRFDVEFDVCFQLLRSHFSSRWCCDFVLTSRVVGILFFVCLVVEFYVVFYLGVAIFFSLAEDLQTAFFLFTQVLYIVLQFSFFVYRYIVILYSFPEVIRIYICFEKGYKFTFVCIGDGCLFFCLHRCRNFFYLFAIICLQSYFYYFCL